MGSQRVDLHMHTNHSDGLCSPQELLELVCRRRLAAFSVTDHDTLEGYRAIKAMLDEPDEAMQPFVDRVPDIILITGVELSVVIDGSDVHILAYAFDPENKTLNSALVGFQEKRNQRGRDIVERLNEMGLDVSFGLVLEKAGNGVIGRPHIAEALTDCGAIDNYEVAFQKYIGKDGPAYVPKAYFEPEEAMKMVHDAGGVTVLAHPAVDNTARFIEDLVQVGLDGIEVHHPFHKKSDCDRFAHLADRFRLLRTGGSDFHGREGRNGEIGSQPVRVDILEAVLQRAEQYQQ
jgi:predicted metal-dependent phosphoesterase TrpH